MIHFLHQQHMIHFRISSREMLDGPIFFFRCISPRPTHVCLDIQGLTVRG